VNDTAATVPPAPSLPGVTPHRDTGPAKRPEADDSSPSVHRLVAFSDGVFAIAITLLVFQLKVPRLAGTPSAGQLAGALWHDRAAFLGYGFSFAVIAVFWFGHHRAFRHIARHDQRLAWWNTAYLATIAFLPFASALLGRYPGNAVAASIYATTLSASLLLAAGLWRHAHRAGLLHPALPPRLARWVLIRALTLATIFAASAAIAAITISGAEALWVLAPAASTLLGHAYRDVRRL
jgi:uncharacterized membrane protein